MHVRFNCVAVVFWVTVTAWCTAASAAASNESLVVGIKEAPPFAIKTADGSWEGISVELWRRAAEALEVRYEYRELELEAMLEQVESGRIDIGIGALTVTPEREQVMDFSHPFYHTGLAIVTARRSDNPWLAVARGFVSGAFLKTVGALIMVLLVVGALLWLAERKRNTAQFHGDPVRGLGDGFWWSAVTMTTVGYGDKAPVTPLGRALAVVWMFAAIVIISGITATITSALTVSQLETPLQGPEDLPDVRVATLDSSTSARYLAERRIAFSTVDGLSAGLEAVMAGRFDALVYDAPLLRYHVNREFKGELAVLPETFMRQDYGFAMPSGSALRERINRSLLAEIKSSSWQDILYRYLGD